MAYRPNRVNIDVHYDFFKKFLEPARKDAQKKMPYKIRGNVEFTKMLTNPKLYNLKVPKIRFRKVKVV